MKKSTKISAHPQLLRRKLVVSLVVFITFLFLLLINVGSYIYIKRTGINLEASLNKRLTTAATMASILIENDLNNLYNPTDMALINLNLKLIEQDANIQSAYIIDSECNVLVDAGFGRENLSRGYLLDDSTTISQAITKGISISELHTLAGNHFKNAYAIISDVQENQAILVLEANAQFFDLVRFYKKGLYLATFISIFVFTFLTIFLVVATSKFLRTEEKLLESQRLAALGQMAATMAHEIRNPLGIIKSTNDVLREKYSQKDFPEELFTYVDDEVKRLNRIVNDFLAFAREPVLNLTTCDFNRLLKETVRQFQATNASNIGIQDEFEKEIINVVCDVDKIRQVLLNILLNAWQSVDNKSGKIRIWMIRRKQFVEIFIKDNGPGFQNNIEHIFEPFYTTKTQGTGLGLSVCKSIIEKHGGKIRAENSPDGGALLCFTLPIR